MQLKKYLPLVSLILSLSLVGCAEKISMPEFNAQYYPDCYEPIAKLCGGNATDDMVTLGRTLLGSQSWNWSKERVIAELSNSCYQKRIVAVKESYQKKKMSKEELVARMQEIKSAIANLNTLQKKTGVTFDTEIADSEKFLKEEEARLAKQTRRSSSVKKVKTESGSSVIKRASNKDKALLEEQLKQMDEQMEGNTK